MLIDLRCLNLDTVKTSNVFVYCLGSKVVGYDL